MQEMAIFDSLRVSPPTPPLPPPPPRSPFVRFPHYCHTVVNLKKTNEEWDEKIGKDEESNEEDSINNDKVSTDDSNNAQSGKAQMCKFLGLFSFGGQELCQGRIKVLNKNGLGATNKGKFSLKGNKSLKGLKLDVKTAKAIAAVADGSICKVERLDEILQAAQVKGGNKLEVKQRFKFLQLQHWGWGKKITGG